MHYLDAAHYFVLISACVTRSGPYICSLDAVSKALSFEETTSRSMFGCLSLLLV